MGNYISFPDGVPEHSITKLVLNLVDPATDAGSIARLVASSLGTLEAGTAANIDSDPLIDYRAQRPWVNYQNGHLAGMWREGMTLSAVKDVEGTEFLRLHGAEPDFHWDSLVADMLDIVERFGVQSIYSFTAIGAPVPHTRPADMIVRSTEPDASPDTLEADFWYQASFADYLEYHASRLDIPMTNVAVRVPVYLASHHYSAGAVGALSMIGQISGLRFPVGDLQHDVARQNEHITELCEENQELGQIITAFEKEYDEKGVTPGFVTAPDMDITVPSVDEIGRAAEQFLAQVDSANERPHMDNQFDPQGLARRIDEIRRARSWRADNGETHRSTWDQLGGNGAPSQREQRDADDSPSSHSEGEGPSEVNHASSPAQADHSDDQPIPDGPENGPTEESAGSAQEPESDDPSGGPRWGRHSWGFGKE